MQSNDFNSPHPGLRPTFSRKGRREQLMRRALQLAHHAASQNEVPVGAVIVLNGEIIGEGWNQPIRSNDPTAHAEIIALRNAAEKIGNYRLIDTEMYVTLEPCIMCVGAMVHARISRLVYGADDPKTGAVKSVFNLSEAPFLNHKIAWEGGILKDECGKILQNFFKLKR